MRRMRGGRDDGGFALLLLAFSMVLLMAMAAFAVDLGAAYNDRRQDQSAADAAALAGVQELGDATAIVAQVRSRMAATLGVEELELDLDDCGAGDLPPGFVGIPGAACVGLDGTGRRVAVRTPWAETQTAFGRVVGLEAIEHSAFAVAGLTREGFGGLLPFGLFGVDAINYGCLRPGTGAIPAELASFCQAQGGGGTNPPGNFGAIDFGAYIDPVLACRTNEENERLANNVAVGADHDLSLWEGPGVAARGSTLHNSQNCPDWAPLLPNAVQIITGNAIKGATAAGLWHGGTFNDGLGPRLTRYLDSEPSYMRPAGAHRTALVAGAQIDDVPLWELIDPEALDSVPVSCRPDQFTGPDGVIGTADDLAALPSAIASYFENNFVDPSIRVLALFDRCFTHHAGQPWPGFQPVDNVPFPFAEPGEEPSCPNSEATCGGVLFGRNESSDPRLWDIQFSPRFGYAPVLVDIPGNNRYDGILRFQPVFIHGIYASCSAGNNSVCSVQASPMLIGGTNPSATQSELAALSTVVLPPATLPGGLGGDQAPFEFGVNVFARLLR